MHLSRNLQTAKSVICDVYRELERRCHEASCCTFQFVVVSWKRTWTIQNTSCLPGAATVWRIGSFGPKMICATQFVQQEWKHYYRRVTFRNVIEALSRLSKSSTFGPRTRTRPSDKKGLHPPSSTCENFWSEFAAESMSKRPACSSLPAIPWRLCRRTLNAGPDVYCNRCVTTWKLQIQPDTAQVRTLHILNVNTGFQQTLLHRSPHSWMVRKVHFIKATSRARNMYERIVKRRWSENPTAQVLEHDNTSNENKAV